MTKAYVIHDNQDLVAVAIRDISPGEDVTGQYQSGREHPGVHARAAIPLGHKIALVDIDQGDRVVKYGTAIGRATQAIRAGDHVHTHNLKGERWA